MPLSRTDRFPADPRLLVFALLFLFSGAAGLIYQIVWERLLEIYFGVTQVSITLIVGAFMAGLGIGSLLGGRLAQRVRSTLAVYGLLEIGIGLFGLASLSMIHWIGQAGAGASYPLVFALSFLILLLPTALMGMTLPLLSQSFITRVDISGQVIGLLYGINTLGAAIGALASAYGLIGFFGLDGANYYAVAINLLVGLGALALARRDRQTTVSAPQKAAPAKRTAGWGYGTILTASFLVGFIGLGYEMLWMRLLAILNKSTSYLFPSVLFVFLVALALGGYLWGRRADRTADPYALFWKIEIAAAITASLTFLLMYWALSVPRIGEWVTQNFHNFQQPLSPMVQTDAGVALFKRLMLSSLSNYFLTIIVLVFPTGLILGGGLPVLDRIAIESPQVAGRRVGDVHVANIIGSVTGTLLVSFGLLSTIGSEGTYKLLTSLSLIFPVLYFTSRTRKQTARTFSPGLVLTIGLLIVLVVILPGRGHFYGRLFAVAGGTTAAQVESGDTLLTLTESSNGNQALWIGGETHSGFPSDGLYAAQAGTCVSAISPERILVIGLGGGHTASFYANLPGVREIVVVELAPQLRPFLEREFLFVRDTLSDPRVTYHVDDGRRWLYAHADEHFDLIAIDPLRRYTTGHNNLYSQEAMTLYRDHLNQDGVFCAWFDKGRSIPATAASVFDHVDTYQEMLIASESPLNYDLDILNDAVTNYMNAESQQLSDLASKILDPEHILSTFWLDRPAIMALPSPAPLLKDNQPWLEYYYFRAPDPVRQSLTPEEVRNSFLERIQNCDDACRTRITSYFPR